jgi:hypothetical protein
MRATFARLRRCLLPLMLFGALAVPCAHAMSPEEFAALEPEEALRLPVLEALEVFGWQREEFLFVLENALIDLRYLYRTPSGKTSKASAAAVRTFQQEAGYEPTGVLLVSEFMELVRRGSQFWQAPIFPGPVVFSETAQAVSIEGTWAGSGSAERDPIQSSSVRCLRAAGICSAVTAKLRMGEEEDGWFHAAGIDLSLATRDWSITQWSADGIEAEDQSSLCVKQRLSIDLKRQRATLHTEPQDEERCRASAQPPRVQTLESGYEIAARYWEARQNRAHQLRSKAFQQLVERISGKPAKK